MYPYLIRAVAGFSIVRTRRRLNGRPILTARDAEKVARTMRAQLPGVRIDILHTTTTCRTRFPGKAFARLAHR